MAASKKKPTDTTGRMLDEAKKQMIEEQQESAARMAMATAQKQIELETQVIDATVPNRATIIVDEPTVVTSGPETEIIRLSDDVENMTYGAGNFYSFKAGQKYEVTKDLANHLRSLGYVASVG